MLRAVLLLGLAHAATALTIGAGPALQPRVAATVMMAKKAAPKGKDVQARGRPASRAPHAGSAASLGQALAAAACRFCTF